MMWERRLFGGAGFGRVLKNRYELYFLQTRAGVNVSPDTDPLFVESVPYFNTPPGDPAYMDDEFNEFALQDMKNDDNDNVFALDGPGIQFAYNPFQRYQMATDISTWLNWYGKRCSDYKHWYSKSRFKKLSSGYYDFNLVHIDQNLPLEIIWIEPCPMYPNSLPDSDVYLPPLP